MIRRSHVCTRTYICIVEERDDVFGGCTRKNQRERIGNTIYIGVCDAGSDTYHDHRNEQRRKKWRGEGDSNPRVLSDNGLAVHRLTGLGHLRSDREQVESVIKTLDSSVLGSK